MQQTLFRFGVDFRTTPVAVREQLAFDSEAAAQFLGWLAETRRAAAEPAEALLLSTCNRIEFYLVTIAPEECERRLIELFRRRQPSPPQGYDKCVRYRMQGEQAAEGLFRVAAGLESQIPGDTHILGQVREAIRISRRAGMLGRVLGEASTAALRAAKRVRSETGLSGGSHGIGGAVLRCIRAETRRLASPSVLVLGAGQAAMDVAHHLAKFRPGVFRFAARRLPEATRLAEHFGGEPVEWEKVHSAMEEADVVIAATSVRLPVLQRDYFEAAILPKRVGRPLLVIDAGVPRNADPELDSLSGVVRRDLDALSEFQRGTESVRLAQIAEAEAILADERTRWARRLKWLELEPAVKELYRFAEEVRLRTVAEWHPDAPVNEMTGRLIRRVLDGPVRKLRRRVLAQTEEDLSIDWWLAPGRLGR